MRSAECIQKALQEHMRALGHVQETMFKAPAGERVAYSYARDALLGQINELRWVLEEEPLCVATVQRESLNSVHRKC